VAVVKMALGSEGDSLFDNFRDSYGRSIFTLTCTCRSDGPVEGEG
jgi:hypothetical protein